ncbi:MAG: nucleoside monophosphate kinase [Parcubacteria group bacterium]|nr:nucleoside monophosphate kinase [Parcubacteria group bacterium]
MKNCNIMSDNQPQIIILLGRSGCGKGTQAKLLIKEFGFDYLSSGKLLRERSKKDDFTGKKLKQVMDKGDLVPTPVMFRFWAGKIAEMRKKINKNGLIVDGSPRFLIEAKLMDSAFEWYEWDNVKVVLLDISEQEAFSRLTKRRICKNCSRLIPWVGEFKDLEKCDKCGGELETRFDDKPEAIQSRLDFYKKDVQPAIDYYEKQGRLIKINGEQSIEDVYQEIIQCLHQ